MIIYYLTKNKIKKLVSTPGFKLDNVSGYFSAFLLILILIDFSIFTKKK